MTPYELEAWAFSLDPQEKPEAFLVVADAFEESGDLPGAEVRRSWSAQMGQVAVPGRAPGGGALLGHYFSIERSQLQHSADGVYRENGRVFQSWSRSQPLRELNNEGRPTSAWYDRKGHWNRRKALQKLSLAELARRNEGSV